MRLQLRHRALELLAVLARRGLVESVGEIVIVPVAHGVENLGKVARIDPTKNPKEIDYLFNEGSNKGKTQKGIYKFDGDTYTDCCSEPGGERPTEFKSTKENGWEIMVFKRIKKDE